MKSIYPNVLFVAPFDIIHPEVAELLAIKIIGRFKGQIWEQFELPIFLDSLNNPILLNLTNTAPLLYNNNIVTIHDVAYLVYPNAYSKKFLLWYKFMVPKLLSKAKHVFTVSEFSKKEINKYYSTDLKRISVLYNAVNEEFQCHSYTGIINEKPYFLALSSLSERKNLISLFKAFNLVKETVDNLELLIIGDLSTNSFAQLDISEFINRKDIRFIGRVSDQKIIEYYSGALAFVFPSFYEGFGIPPLEAQACGCPVIVSKETSLPEIFLNSALYCNPHSIEDIASSMLKILNIEQRERLIESGNVNIKRFSWKESTLQLLKIIETVNS
ncbi:glycosyltransferase family 4 protein [Flectobacillus longus]|uniref:glycosyltransferase family 4 protein n=1 Tax=Flectobacillus longus TaxID=2984207 RepID=UPI0024B7D6EF|nr:glycosyltransferase family 1 protein [Flectobacillus longus]MDI9880069.1 glycosyltransferase family 1 protein [Flectobacillus longus]